jgi:cyclopropane-fatty-acyl-phospholipid synthase
VTVRVTDNRVALQVVRDPALGTVETWMDDRLQLVEGEIIDLILLIRRNSRWEERSGRSKFKKYTGRLKHLVNTYNRKTNSKKNVAHHYDIGNDIYRTFLDPDMQYSCGYFTDPGNSIEQAQLDKKAHIASKLHLSPGQKVVDIGCGWGGLALYLNRVADVDVLGVTLSTEQLAVARERAARAGVADRVKFELMDYRDLEGRSTGSSRSACSSTSAPRSSRPSSTRSARSSSPTASRWSTPWAGWASRARPTRSCRSTSFPGGYLPSLSEMVARASASGW